MASFSIPLTGLEADSKDLNTIANNLSNMNTTAYKDQTTTFASLFYQQLGQSGSGDPIEEGLGVQVDSTSTDFTSGTINNTGVNSDMAINGSGFFVAQNANGQQFLTRAGNFTTNANGNLTTSNGLEVMGYPAVNGTINANGLPSPIIIPTNATQPPKATQNMGIDMNLNATAVAGTTVPVPVTLYDSLGKAQQATVNFTAAGNGTWNYAISLPGATGPNTNTIGTLQFNGSGVLLPSSTVNNPVTFSGFSDNASPLSFKFNLFDANGNPTITQTASPSAATATPQDGYAGGNYQSFSVDQNGVISATYSNGLTAPLAQLAIASVSNEQGLTPVGGNDYQASLASGQASLGVAGTGSRGTIDGSSLEASNVNISTEFANLIVAQRAFEANSKSVTTFDTVTQDTINMIR